MSTPKDRVSLHGSDRKPVPGARATGPVDPAETFQVSLLLRGRRAGADISKMAADIGEQAPQQRKHLSREEFAREAGATAADIAAVEKFAHDHGLTVVQTSAPRRTVVLSGSAEAYSNAFGVQLERYEHPDGGTYRGRSGPVQIPRDLEGIVTGVFGLDDRPQATTQFRAAAAAAAAGGFTPVDISRLYDFPAGRDGGGQTIAILELGGGYTTADLQAYFRAVGVAEPNVSAVSVDGGQNQPTGAANGPDGEVMLDIEVAGGVAPKAAIAVYFAPNTDRGFLDALTTAVHDAVRKPSVISISWGGAETNWTAQAMQAFDQAAQEAAALGVTVCAAAGDGGSDDGVGDGKAHVDFPASSPHILACGGTSLVAQGGAISSETVWNDGAGAGATGGGFSTQFARPAWQSAAKVPSPPNPPSGRGVPDVAGDADPVTGYQVQVDGKRTVYGGTSAVAPLWSGLIALINQGLGAPVGFLNPLLYTKVSAAAFHDITSGSNGAYSAAHGWDPCTGLGSPDGAHLLTDLGGPAH